MAGHQTSQILILILLAFMSHRIMARSSYIPKQDLKILLNEIDNSDESYIDPGQFAEIEPMIRRRLPWLKDLYSADDEDSASQNLITDRPYQSPQQDPIPSPLALFRGNLIRKNISKGHLQKKSNSWTEYMTPCHFKICNFGRKRNVVLI